jgi:hypothetical protein
LALTAVVSREKFRVAAPLVVVDRFSVTPAIASFTLLLLLVMATPLTVSAALAAFCSWVSKPKPVTA